MVKMQKKRKGVKRIEKFVSRFPFSGNKGNALGLHDQMKLQKLARKRGREKDEEEEIRSYSSYFNFYFKLCLI